MATDSAIEKKEGAVVQPERVRGGSTYTPAVDISEGPDEWLLVADVPGATAQDIDVRYEKGELSIYARVEPRRAQENTRYWLREYGVGDYYRCFQIGEGIDPGQIQAEVANGVLTLHLPKSEAVKPKRIAVKSV